MRAEDLAIVVVLASIAIAGMVAVAVSHDRQRTQEQWLMRCAERGRAADVCWRECESMGLCP